MPPTLLCPSARAGRKAVRVALRPLPGWTSISGAIDFCTSLLMTCGYTATRRVIDISGDGANNDGRKVGPIREQILACTDVAQLETWVRRAATATAAEDVIGE